MALTKGIKCPSMQTVAQKSQNNILGKVLVQGTKVLEQAPSSEPTGSCWTICSNKHSPQTPSVCYFCVALIEQHTSHALPRSRHDSYTLSKASNAPHRALHWSFQTLFHLHTIHPQSPSPKYKLRHVRLSDQIHHVFWHLHQQG